MGPQNGIMGSFDAFDLPRMEVDNKQLEAEQRMAKFSKTREFKVLKEYMQARIDFFQKYLPDGRALTEVSEDERGKMWVAANVVISEFNAVIKAYENASEAVKNAK